MDEALEPVGMSRDRFGDPVVGIACEFHGLGGGQRLESGRRQGEHMHIDARVVHVGQTALG